MIFLPLRSRFQAPARLKIYLTMSELGLNEHHQATVINYMRFARYQRGQRIRGVKACFEELKDSRLIEDTFTIDEVTEMLDGLLAVVTGEVETELINTAHTNILLLRQLFQQAEKWHLKLQADISELENRELLEKIKDFEEREFAGTKREVEFNPMTLTKLEPLNEGGAGGLLQKEIERLTDENSRLRERLKQIESTAIQSQHDQSILKSDLEKTKSELMLHRQVKGSNSEEELADLKKKMEGLKSTLDMSEAANRNATAGISSDLTSTKHELLKVQEMLEMTEKELEKKVCMTAPFKNLKQMLQRKNEQIKELRRTLSKYETTED
ncbi:Leucine zipper transcription factor-like protein 1 [Lamellibrachia satsuma]|nr:Leucine zipper transcription factor-like protein 1 [Lamellibrachia satsuma]